MKMIEPTTNILQMLKEHPETAKVLASYNLGCVGCQGSHHESVERGANAHGLDVAPLLRDLNSAIAIHD